MNRTTSASETEQLTDWLPACLPKRPVYENNVSACCLWTIFVIFCRLYLLLKWSSRPHPHLITHIVVKVVAGRQLSLCQYISVPRLSLERIALSSSVSTNYKLMNKTILIAFLLPPIIRTQLLCNALFITQSCPVPSSGHLTDDEELKCSHKVISCKGIVLRALNLSCNQINLP